MKNFKISDYTFISSDQGGQTEIIDYGVKMVGAPLEWKETMGEGIRVGIIDTGISTSHPDLKWRIADGISFLEGSREDIEDTNGHGTHVAGIVAAEKNGIGVVGVAPKVKLYICKAFDTNGKTDYYAIEKSILWLIKCGVSVINMSFSSGFSSKRYSTLVHLAHKNGITMICAAGNEGEKGEASMGYPASFNETIAVSAVDCKKNIASFSSRGPSAEISAAGIDIYSTFIGNSYATLSGTSMATPIITGAVAILQAKGRLRYGRNLTPDEIRLLLNIYTEDLSGFGKDDRYGYGLFSFGRISGSDYIDSEKAKRNIKAKTNLSQKMSELIVAMLLDS